MTNSDPTQGLPTVTGADLPPLAWVGSEPFDRDRVEPVADFVSVSGKPRGGLWLSPVTGDQETPTTPWSEWLLNGRDIDSTELHIQPVALRPDAAVARVDAYADWVAICARFPGPATPFGAPGGGTGTPDPVAAFMSRALGARASWEAIANAGIDAVWVTEAAARERPSAGAPLGLGLWDVETVLVLRPEALAL